MTLDNLLLAYTEGKLSTQQTLEAIRHLKIVDSRHPLSEVQKGLWMLQKTVPGLSAYNVPLCFSLQGPIQPEVLEQAFRFVLAQHPLLNAIVEEVDGFPSLKLRNSVTLELQREDISGLDPGDVLPHIRAKAKEPFLLQDGPLIRACLLSKHGQEHFLLMVVHHIVFDGRSVSLLISLLCEAYRRILQGERPALAQLPATYGEFVEWERRLLASDQGKAHREYWIRQLSGSLPVLKLPTDRPEKTNPDGFDGEMYTKVLSDHLSRQIKALAVSRNANVSALFMSVYKMLLHRYTGENDIVIGIPVMGRPEERFESLIGHFVNTVALRTHVNGSKTFSALLSEVQVALGDALDHAAYPFPRLVRDLKASSAQLRSPIFQAAFEYKSAHLLDRARVIAESEPLCLVPVPGIRQEGEYEIGLEVMEHDEMFELNVIYDPNLFTRNRVERIAAHLENLLAAIIARPEGKIAEFEFLTESESQELLVEWNRTERDFPQHRFAHELIQEHAAKTPDAIAVKGVERTLTYDELNKNANRLAHYLRELGVGAETKVGLCMARSPEVIVAFLAVLKAGGMFVPMDPDYPAERLRFMMADSQISVLLTESSLVAKLPTVVSSIALDSEWPAIVSRSAENLVTIVHPESAAYVIYTSGSTGTPKGVINTQCGLTNLAYSQWHLFSPTPKDNVLQFSSWSFDAAVFEWLIALSSGAQLVVGPKERRAGRELEELINTADITITVLPPTAVATLTEANVKGLRILIVSGEACVPELAKRWAAGRSMFNGYGPAENTVAATISAALKTDGDISIGRPIPNVKVYVLDNEMKPVAAGVAGELYLGGAALARGYLNRPDLTAEKFVPNPFCEGERGERLYRTGDLVRYRSDSTLEFLGRVDHQVKLRGYRVELGEIETALQEVEGVLQSAVLMHGTESKRLVGYVVLDSQMNLHVRELREKLRNRLPDYMVPAVLVPIDALPLTPSGKVDRNALAQHKIVQISESSPGSTPRSAVQERILHIWKSVLNVAEVGIHDGFFDCGGDSILAVTVAEKLQREFSVEFTATTIFKHPTIDGLSKYLAERGRRVALPENERSLVDSRQRKGDLTARSYPAYYADSVAIIGISCQFPGAQNHYEFWNNLRHGKESIQLLSPEELQGLGVPEDVIKDPNYVPVSSAIQGRNLFDPKFFNITPRDAELMDPQLRLLLLHSWKAVEDAGYIPKDVTDCAVLMTACNSSHQSLVLSHVADADGNDRYVSWALSQCGTIPTTISHKLGLKGPSLFLHSNCSSSLVGLDAAYRTLVSGGSRYVLVGAATIFPSPSVGYVYQEGMAFSRSGHVRTFDAAADGMIPGEGVAVVMLKRTADALADGDHIYAILRGIAVNNDGSNKVGFYAPSLQGQSEVIDKVLKSTGIDPEAIGYIEAHGTGTRLGDPVELTALSEVYRKYTDRKQFCGIGSVKTNVGHLDTAAGLAGCIKAAFCLSQGVIPPTLHYVHPNPGFDFEASPFYVADTLQNWHDTSTPRRAAVSSFGIGGTNAHAILEQGPDTVASGERVQNGAGSLVPYLVPLSARNEDRLLSYARDLHEFLASHQGENTTPSPEPLNLTDLSYTLQIGREAMAYRVIFVVNAIPELIGKLGDFTAGQENLVGCFAGAASGSKGFEKVIEAEDSRQLVTTWIAQGNLEKLARLWVRGVNVEWNLLYSHGHPRRISLPAYPFAKEMYEIPNVPSHAHTICDECANGDEDAHDLEDDLLPSQAAERQPSGNAKTSRIDFSNVDAVLDCENIPECQRENPSAQLVHTGEHGDVGDRLRAALVGVVASFLKMKVEEIEIDRQWSGFGFDSISMTTFAELLNQSYHLELTPAVFFEHSSLRSLAAYMLQQHPFQVAAKFPAHSKPVEMKMAAKQPSAKSVQRALPLDRRSARPSKRQSSSRPEPQSPEPIAIVGVSGCFPQAAGLDAFWENLCQGKDCITEIPRSRWVWQAVYGDPFKDGNKTNIRWGGFIDGVDEFDPLFFGISPHEAQLMDPQQRLLMTYVWKVIEDAGYSAQSISGSRTALFIATAGSGYDALSLHSGLPVEAYSLTGLVPSAGPGRMSYYLNLHGPSEPVETACSSSLVAIHRGILAINNDECEAVIAGGVNTIVSPLVHISASKTGTLSEDGRCKAFSAQANGMVRGEGVGMLFLKKLSAAERDGDHIYALIRSSSQNHGGRASSFTAPNSWAQGQLLKSAYARAGVDPRTVGYIEAHGTGTVLGDPIEINALQSAFKELYEMTDGPPVQGPHCGLGSVKTNIGHLELAAGVAGVIKVLLQMRHKKLVKSLHSEELNPHIQLEGSPFYVVRETQPWRPVKDEQGHDVPLRAGVSSFGIGGVNAHVVLEEYVPREYEPSSFPGALQPPAIVVLSARNEDRLTEQARQLRQAIDKQHLQDGDLPRVTYTLQVGRESMETRLAATVTSIDDLKSKLDRYLQGEAVEDVYRGAGKRNNDTLSIFASDEDMQSAVQAWVAKGKFTKLLELWVKGFNLDWGLIHQDPRPQRISLPTYPFAKERYWLAGGGLPLEKRAENVELEGQTGLEGTEPGGHSSTAHVPDKATGSSKTTEIFELMTFDEIWEPRTLAPSGDMPARTLICFLSDVDRQEAALEAAKGFDEKVEVIFVSQGGSYQKHSPRHYSVSPRENNSSFIDVLNSIHHDHDGVDGLLYLWPLEDPNYIHDFGTLVDLIKAIATAALRCPRVLLAGEAGSGVDGCYFESWMGFERSLGLVLPNTRVAVVWEKVDAPSAADAGVRKWVSRLWQELQSSKLESAFYKNGCRHVARVLPGATEMGPREKVLRQGGTYLITGGCGGLGLQFARHLASNYSAKLILTGRSPLSETKTDAIRALEAKGAQVEYVQADICDLASMQAAVQLAAERFGSIHGVIHAAGVAGQLSIMENNFTRFQQVLQPKIKGTLVLEEVLKDQPLDFICYFSSSSAILGDFGGCDYAIANRFELAHAEYHNQLVEQGRRSGKTLAVCWPHWSGGGMGPKQEEAESARFYLKSSGQRLLEIQEGLQTFERLLEEGGSRRLVIVGQPSRVHRFLGIAGTPVASELGNSVLAVSSSVKGRRLVMKGFSVVQCILWDLKEQACELLKIERKHLDAEENLAEFGLDSIGLAEYAKRLTQHYGFEVTPSIFFSYPTLARLTEYFGREHRAEMEEFYGREAASLKHAASERRQPVAQEREHDGRDEKSISGMEEPARILGTDPARPAVAEQRSGRAEPIAIVGMSGRFPQSRSVKDMWRILAEGRDAVEEIPGERFDWKQYYGDPRREANKTSCRWSGIVPGAAEFDPLFFEISPLEAESMDPRQRLLMQESWKALEDAGYGATQIQNQKIGMFVGVEQGDYQFLAGPKGGMTGNHDGILACRLSYFLNLHGPAMAINTACSSGLVAVHQACLSLRAQECDAAIAAAVNMLFTPHGYIGMSRVGMLSEDGKCYAFDRRANGMVPGEAVVAVVLKRLSQAKEDGDPIYAVILGSGINYDGKTNGITAPSGASQVSLLRDVYGRTGVSAAEIEYIVTHGTGTQLGDPIEINALNEVFKSFSNERGFCALTSSKTNFGHTLAASGLLSLVSLVQAMRHEMIPASLHCEYESDYVEWESSPFYVNKANKRWPRRASQGRLGGVSSFGMSGTNAHVVVESYDEKEVTEESIDTPPYFVLALSAKTATALEERVAQLQEELEAREWDRAGLRAMSYTLLCGRQHLEHRWSMVITDLEHAREGCRHAGRKEKLPYLFSGKVGRDFSGAQAILRYAEELLTQAGTLQREVEKYQEALYALADLYCQGYELSWERLFGESKPRRIPLPTYPFAREEYWTRNGGVGLIADSPDLADGSYSNGSSNGELPPTVRRVFQRVFEGALDIGQAKALLESHHLSGTEKSSARIESRS
jgi:polyketide synthase PksN